MCLVLVARPDVAEPESVLESTHVPHQEVRLSRRGADPAGTATLERSGAYLLRRDRTTIGRAPECDIRISHPTVSQLHAELAWIDGRPTIGHPSPVNPTLVNGLPIGEPRTLRSGDLIEIAETIVFRLELFGSDDELTEPRHGDERRMYAIVCADVAGYSRLSKATISVPHARSRLASRPFAAKARSPAGGSCRYGAAWCCCSPAPLRR